MASAVSSMAQRAQVSLRKIPVAALIGGAISAVGNIVLFFVAQALGVVFAIPMGGPGAPVSALPLAAVGMLSFMPAIGAGILLALLARFSKNALMIFWIISGVFLLVSFIPTLSLPVDIGIRLSLSLMHVVSGAAIVWALSTRTAS